MAASSDFPASSAKRARMAGGAGLAAGLAGIFASSCCVLPLVLVAFGLGSAGAAVIPALAALRLYLIAAAILAVAVGWLSHLRGWRTERVGTACAAAAAKRPVPLWLGLASAVVLLALAWQPLVEPWLLARMR
jgi:mercuric ion transport protein